jgi:hypothetical protein
VIQTKEELSNESIAGSALQNLANSIHHPHQLPPACINTNLFSACAFLTDISISAAASAVGLYNFFSWAKILPIEKKTSIKRNIFFSTFFNLKNFKDCIRLNRTYPSNKTGITDTY